MMPRALIILALVALTACGSRQDTADRDTNLRQLRNPSGTPEEFSIVPSKPLQAPESLSELPNPTPGGENRTDQTPLKDAVAVLGGSPARLNVQAGINLGMIFFRLRDAEQIIDLGQYCRQRIALPQYLNED